MEFGTFETTLKNLESQYDNLIRLSPDYPSFIQEGMAESVIQRFEICYDTAWTTLRRYLVERLALPEVPNSPKPVFRIAAQNVLLADAAERWPHYAETRIETTHIYDGAKAAAAIVTVSDFIKDATDLYSIMTGDPWR